MSTVRWSHFVVLVFSCCYLKQVYSHGYLHDPPQRSSLWRHGINAPKNYNDYGLNCGGIEHQWTNNNGRCGVCGDPWGRERHHEDGGKYARGIIGRKYISGDVIDTVVNITAWHRGWFEYKLCPIVSPYIPVTQNCLDQHPVYLANGSKKFHPNRRGVFHVKIQLPDGLSCSQCVLQWTYITSNNWGCNDRGQCGLGYDPYPEQFVNCADIQITPVTNNLPTNTNDIVVNVLSNPIWSSENDTSSESSEEENVTKSQVENTQPITAGNTNGKGSVKCHPKGPYRAVPGMKEWCNIMCLSGLTTVIPSCPSSHCECTQWM